MIERFCIMILFLFAGIGILGGPILWNSKRPEQKKADQRIEKGLDKKSEPVIPVKEIRVLISNHRLGHYDHKEVKVTSDQDYHVEIDGKKQKKKAGQITTILFQRGKQDQKIVCYGTGKMQLLSVRRSCGYPAYRGMLYIQKRKNGYQIINHLLLEEYLYAVLPSEMPVSYGLEALKVQAVCARSFAVKQIKSKKFAKYGADVDDSVASQVYHEQDECRESIQAVQETNGEVLMHRNKVITTYFFSTSWGHTADSHDVWIQKGKSPVYLRGKLQVKDGTSLNLSAEKELRKFLNGKRTTYDAQFPWYRWHVKIPLSRCSDRRIGKVQRIEVTKRGNSGVVKEIRITGNYGVRVITGEYQIRNCLSPKGIPIQKQDGKQGYLDLLPSGCFYLDMHGKIVTIFGGGYGHGVGMSQNGVKVQVASGKDYEEILKHYYPKSYIATLP